MPELHILRVFVDDEGNHGNPLGVFLEGGDIAPERRQAVAADLGFSETIFVDDVESGAVVIKTPTVELPFAGHPLVGVAWLLAECGNPVDTLRPPAGDVEVRRSDELTIIAGRPEWSPEFEFLEHPWPKHIDALEGPPPGEDAVSCWAWIDEPTGQVRARVFPPRYGIDEDEATGSAAIRLAALLDRSLDIRQGVGSRIVAHPLDDGRVELGGRAVLEVTLDYGGRG